jgi:hypothetical protein
MVQLRRRIKLISWWNFFYIFGVNNFPILLRGDLNLIRRECETNKKRSRLSDFLTQIIKHWGLSLVLLVDVSHGLIIK